MTVGVTQPAVVENVLDALRRTPAWVTIRYDDHFVPGGKGWHDEGGVATVRASIIVSVVEPVRLGAESAPADASVVVLADKSAFAVSMSREAVLAILGVLPPPPVKVELPRPEEA